MKNIEMLDLVNRLIKEKDSVHYDSLPAVIQKEFFLKIAREKKLNQAKNNRRLEDLF